ncbi:MULTISPECIES: hypothetical protein [Nguyenibacter]|uniref:Pectate lyase superfamily protein domain-containing protein n=1 Tax=Nguyenibacter vanlangensis TaxID=1216886 RepID=A0A7Y7ITF8_9PROT|nr:MULTISPECIES: hypothetical protein [Nguyenibacter]NVN09837.1 hypothetical protein [Nguyenibacter vanlangensis]WRH88628.1 hypothetical protein QN315_03090 [Nguyenibacter sp. L1]
MALRFSILGLLGGMLITSAYAQQGTMSDKEGLGQVLAHSRLTAPMINGGTATGLNVNRQISLLSYGAKCDGVTDDTKAINKWLANAAGMPADVELEAPAGVCVFTAPLANPGGVQANHVDLHGAGPYATTFLYMGHDSQIDLLTIGDGVSPQKNWSLHDFRIASNTRMSAGTALHVRGMVRSAVGNIVLDGQEGNGKLWNGVWFDEVDFIATWGQSYAVGQNDAFRINGGRLGSADFSLLGWKIGPTDSRIVPRIGVHIGGGLGGFVCGPGTDIIGNGTNVLIDNALVRVTNRELFFASGCFIDSSASGAGVEVNDTQGNAGDLYISFAGSWIASSATSNLQLDKAVRGHLVFSGGTIFNARGDGVHDVSMMRQTYSGTQFRQNGRGGTGGYGFNALSSASEIMLIGDDFEGNYNGPMHGKEHVLSDDAATFLARRVDLPLIWTADTSQCGSLPGASGCLVLRDAKRKVHFIPAWGGAAGEGTSR